MTPTYLSAQFEKETGVALLAYISNVRVEAAKQLLTQGLSVAKIAEQTGYRDSGSLIRVFKKVTGMTPRAVQGCTGGVTPKAKAGLSQSGFCCRMALIQDAQNRPVHLHKFCRFRNCLCIFEKSHL